MTWLAKNICPRRALPELHGKVYNHMLEKIQHVKTLSFTTDICSSDVSPMSLLSLPSHLLDESYVAHSAMLKTTHFRGSHTSDVIAAPPKCLTSGKFL